jgi:hypothetical protein
MKRAFSLDRSPQLPPKSATVAYSVNTRSMADRLDMVLPRLFKRGSGMIAVGSLVIIGAPEEVTASFLPVLFHLAGAICGIDVTTSWHPCRRLEISDVVVRRKLDRGPKLRARAGPAMTRWHPAPDCVPSQHASSCLHCLHLTLLSTCSGCPITSAVHSVSCEGCSSKKSSASQGRFPHCSESQYRFLEGSRGLQQFNELHHSPLPPGRS